MKSLDPKKPATPAEAKANAPALAGKPAVVPTTVNNSKSDTNETQPPAPQTPKTSSWRKHEERMLEKQQQEHQRQLLRQQQQEIYGYMPFKAPSYPIYDQRSQTPREQALNLNYGPSRFEIVNQPEPALPRPGTDIGMYKPSRYQSYTTLPRPEQLEVESLYGGHRPLPMGDIYGALNKSELNNRPASKMSRSYGMSEPVKYRPGSAMSGRMSENHFTVANVAYDPNFGVIQSNYIKLIVNWTGLNLCSYMQGTSVLSPYSGINPTYEAQTISWLVILFVIFMILFCTAGVACCLFCIWRYRMPLHPKRHETYLA